jgi:hypothetical protein
MPASRLVPPALRFAVRSEIFLNDKVALELHSPDFDALTDLALRDVAGQQLAPNSSADYFYAWKRWVGFTKEKNYSHLPAKSDEFVKYLIWLAHNNGTKGAAVTAVHAVIYVHHLNGLDPPGQEHLPALVVNAVKRELAAPVSQKEPLQAWWRRPSALSPAPSPTGCWGSASSTSSW